MGGGLYYFGVGGEFVISGQNVLCGEVIGCLLDMFMGVGTLNFEEDFRKYFPYYLIDF